MGLRSYLLLQLGTGTILSACFVPVGAGLSNVKSRLLCAGRSIAQSIGCSGTTFTTGAWPCILMTGTCGSGFRPFLKSTPDFGLNRDVESCANATDGLARSMSASSKGRFRMMRFYCRPGLDRVRRGFTRP